MTSTEKVIFPSGDSYCLKHKIYLRMRYTQNNKNTQFNV